MPNGLTIRQTVITALLCATACVWTPKSRASCGDYLYTRHSTPTHSKDSFATAKAASDEILMTSAFDAQHRDTAPQGPACSGPGCRKSPDPANPIRWSTVRNMNSSDAATARSQKRDEQSESAPWEKCSDNDEALDGFHHPLDRPPQSLNFVRPL